MSEHEMQREIERLRRELEQSNRSRDRLREMICTILPIDRTEITPEEFEEMKKNARDVKEVLREILPPEMHDLLNHHQENGA